jgi:hypothetical protein
MRSERVGDPDRRLGERVFVRSLGASCFCYLSRLGDAALARERFGEETEHIHRECAPEVAHESLRFAQDLDRRGDILSRQGEGSAPHQGLDEHVPVVGALEPIASECEGFVCLLPRAAVLVQQAEECRDPRLVPQAALLACELEAALELTLRLGEVAAVVVQRAEAHATGEHQLWVVDLF